jgi:chaperonin GroES
MSDIQALAIRNVLIVERIAPERTIGSFGLILTESALEHQDQGIVLLAGKGKYLDNGTIRPNEIKVGDHILYSKYANLEFKHEGKDYVSMTEDDVILVLNRTE